MQYLKGSRRRRSQKTQCYLAAGPASGDWHAGNERTGAYFDATSIGVTLPGPDRVLSSTPLRPYRAFHKSFTKLRTPQIAIIPCRHVLLYMLRNVTSLSVPVSSWLCKTTSWHQQRPWLTFDTATSTFSSEILLTISMNPRCWGGPPLWTIFIATVPIRLSTLHHSSVSTRLHALGMGHSVHELAHPRKRRHLNACEASSLYWHIGDACHSLRELGSTPSKRDRSARPPQERRACVAHGFCPGRIILCSNLRLGIPLSSPVFVSLWRSITNFPSRLKPWGRIRSGSSSPEVLSCILNVASCSAPFLPVPILNTLVRNGRLPLCQLQFTARSRFFDGVFTYVIGWL
ncbi:hypothetical protein ARMGADRAFT_352229 [Armillaria gallica]|uniref:Uncharacterized protein n=1 Tax=Armillaria gallica TaxID=47427 RepID=A0A2H3D1E1_ARMGA|nr:hypothetical protein ARMGADRAFT_352229 [Armillaria gallica]